MQRESGGDDVTRPLTTSEAAEIVNCTPQTIARQCALGKYPGAFRFSRRWRIPREVFRQAIEGETARAERVDLSVTKVKRSSGKPYEPWEIELRRKLRSYG